MSHFDRRSVILGTSAFGASMVLGAPAVIGRAKANVVVIGGGPGGATAAKYIAKDSEGQIAVTLVEPATQFITCFHSNLYLGGFRDMKSITHRYDTLVAQYKIKHARQMAKLIDRDKK